MINQFIGIDNTTNIITKEYDLKIENLTFSDELKFFIVLKPRATEFIPNLLYLIVYKIKCVLPFLSLK